MSSSLSQTDLAERIPEGGDNTACELEETAVQLDHAVAVFARERRRLFGIAYRIVGNAADAEDVVQDVWLRWQSCDRTSVQVPAALLATTATRLAINAIQSARARHETSFNPRQSQEADASADPTPHAERFELLETAVRVVLETLSPAERAAYLLRLAFDYPYWRIAEIIHATEVTSRQLVSRARKRVATKRRKPVTSVQCERLVTVFLIAAQTGQFAALEQLLIADITSSGSSIRPIGLTRVATNHCGIVRRPALPGVA
jgi:RNA polymerase sigma-70 factor (ECF subfamily)